MWGSDQVNEDATPPASPFRRIADTLTHIIREDKMETTAKLHIEEVIKYAWERRRQGPNGRIEPR